MERGILSPEDAARLDSKQLLPLLFRAGFSTQTEVDGDGYNHTSQVRTALSGGAPETDLAVSYGRALDKATFFQADLTWRENAPQAASDVAVRAAVQKRF